MNISIKSIDNSLEFINYSKDKNIDFNNIDNIFGNPFFLNYHENIKCNYLLIELENKLVQMASVIIRKFDEKRPNLCILFSMTNVQDYIVYSVCKARNIKFLQLRSAKIENYITASDNFFEHSVNADKDISKELFEVAEAYVKKIYSDNTFHYEGALLSKKFKPFTSVKRIIAGLKSDIIKLSNSTIRRDNQVEWLFRNNFYSEIINPLRWAFQKNMFSDMCGSQSKYFLYPLHFEPEVAIQFYGTQYLNQIELIRNIAMSLPLGTRLIVKEHPRSYGVRSTKYYKKIQSIPRVSLANGKLSMDHLVNGSLGVFTISGSTGLQAIIRGKPCWTFGKPYFSKIGAKMVRYVENVDDIDKLIFELLEDYQYDRSLITSFVARTLSKSVRFDLYSHYLQKSDRYQFGDIHVEVNDLYELIQREAR